MLTSVNKEMINYLCMLSPVGWLTLFEKSKKLIVLEWGRANNSIETPFLKVAKQQLIEYFNNERTDFTIPLKPAGTNFQTEVWKLISNIPYGQTYTYGQISTLLNSAARPVGRACGKNPIPIFIPCHRVIGSKSKLTGFSGGEGLQTKQYLLTLETRANNVI